MRTLKAGQHKMVFTRGVNDRVAEDTEFSKFVVTSLLRFNRGDWGDVTSDDWKANDADLESLNSGGWYGRILGSYKGTYVPKWPYSLNELPDRIWIIRNTGKEDGTQVITVLFPEEY